MKLVLVAAALAWIVALNTPVPAARTADASMAPDSGASTLGPTFCHLFPFLPECKHLWP